jgi:poly-beta-1,6-N-acetyl-D-glucosamine synthase
MAGDYRRRYAIVSPVRNEAKLIRHTLQSVVGQSEPPVIWVIVDDGSTDETASIVAEYASRTGYIRPISNPGDSRGDMGSDDRLLWAAEAIAFNVGLGEVDLDSIDYIVKLDGDLAFGPDYFSSLMDEFEKDPLLGMAGGYCYVMRKGERRIEWNPPSHVRGPTKMYRLACFRDIGGIQPVYAWDGLDVIKAQMAGWRTSSFPFEVDHLKPTGSVGGMLKARVRQGIGAHLLGYHPLFLPVRSATLSMAPPYVLGGFAFIYGYLKASLRGLPRIADAETVAYLRRQQMQRIRGIWNRVEIKSFLGGGK